MISVAEARRRILDPLRPTPAEIVPLAAAWGRVLAVPVHARLTQPPADVSAMDGYAVSGATRGGTLHVIGHAPAGHPFAGQIAPGEAVRLFTGSVVPPGTDAVLIQENAAAVEGGVVVNALPAPGANIRRAGQDFTAGEALLTPGTRLSARAIGLAAAANHPWLSVHRRPRVAILATGDEISLPGEPIGPGGIVSSNAHTLAALVTAAGGDPTVLPIVGDDPAMIAAALGASTDLLLTTGGASVGDHDLVQAALRASGFSLGFWQVAMRPGKPLLFGDLHGTPVLGLPGNPVSAFVCAVLFLLPALARLTGRTGEGLPRGTARLGSALPANDHREDYLRASLEPGEEGLIAHPFNRQDSSMTKLLTAADALIVRPPHAPAIQAGARVDILVLDYLGL